MWENATPPAGMPPEQKTRKVRRDRSGREDLVWRQALLCCLLLAALYGAKRWALPGYPTVRIWLEQAMQPEQQRLLDPERAVEWFTEEAAQTWRGVTQRFAATSETARPAHAKPDEVPWTCREESYQPPFALYHPLGEGGNAKTSGYGWRADPMGGEDSDFHTGNDLAAAQGTPVLAAAEGVVRLAGVHKSYGNYLKIQHAGGDETLYAHLQYVFVHSGEQVQAGQQLGTVGQTGRVTGPHLHFELWHEGVRYDPTEALRFAK